MRRIFRTRDFQPDPDEDFGEEIQSHRELMVEDLMAGGMREKDARIEVTRACQELEAGRIQATSHTRNRLRRRSLLDRCDTLIQDVRYALRRMARSPGFTLVAVLSLAIGIGANTAVFSVVNAFLIRKAPFRAPEELVRIYTSDPTISPYMSTSYPDFRDIRELDEVFAEVGALETIMAVVDQGGDLRRVLMEAVSASLFPTLGVEPTLGRSFLPEEDSGPGENPVAVLGHGFWEEAFGGDPGVLGQTLTLAGRPYTVVGVAPEWYNSMVFQGLKMDVFVPVSMSAEIGGSSDAIYTRRNNNRFDLVARLAPGVSVGEARARLDHLASQLGEAYPATNRGRSFNLFPNSEVAISPEFNQPLRFTAAFLLAVVGMVLLLACTNLASFLLARGVERQKEVAMRLALGAARGRLIRQFLTETIILGLLGGAVGLVVARSTLAFAVAYQPPIPLPLSLGLGLDRRVFLFTLGISALAGVLFGLAPALQSTRPEVAPTLKDGGGSGPRRRFNLQSWLVTLQMTVSMVLLVGGGLFLRSLVTVQGIDPGFSTEEAGIAWLDLSASRTSDAAREAVRIDLEERLLAQSGIHTVASANRLPLSLGGTFMSFLIPGVDPPAGEDGFRLDVASVAPRYFRAMGIPVLTGRPFAVSDDGAAQKVVMVNEALANRFWPGENPVGKEISTGFDDTPMTVVGLVRTTKVGSLGEAPVPLVYFPFSQNHSSDLQILVRGDLSQGELVATLRRVIREAYPEVVVMEMKTMDQHLSVRLFGPRAAAALLGLFGMLALLLSSIGLYGVVSFSVSRRVREMGIRMSLGADGAHLVRMVVGRALSVVALGGVAGLVVAFFLSRLIQVFLVGVSPADPVTLVGVPLLLGGVALVAALIPALRASRVNPVEALRSE